MRIIAGQLKGRRLEGPTWAGVRPTSDKLRETLFNILSRRIEGARVLDGFAGTGAVGIEALSRGAAQVTFIDSDGRATALIERNLALCGVAERFSIKKGDVGDVLRKLPSDHRFEIIVLDPPYELASTRETLDAAAERLAEDGMLVFERASRREPDIPASLVLMRTVKSGDSSLTFLQRRI